METMKTVAITGASSGIGLETAKYYSQKKFEVLLIARSKEKLISVQKSLPGPSHVICADISEPTGAQKIFEFINAWDKKESLVQFIHNAGVFRQQLASEFTELSYQEQFNTNLMSVMKINAKLFSIFKQNSPFGILNVSSTAALRPLKGMSIYAATKAALNNYTQNLALEWAEFGIRVNAVNPGIIDTPIHDFKPDSEALKNAHSMQPLSRVGKPEEIARLIFDTANNEWMTGSLITLDGGITLV